MQLNINSREFYFLEIPTTPPLPAADASFDDGVSWEPGEPFSGGFRWLVQGPRADDTEELATVITEPTIVPLIRYGAPPQRRVEEGPAITLTS